MAQILPFRAYRPAKELTEKVASLPYDVFSREEARSYVEEHPGAFLAIDRPETFFDPDHDMYADEVYQKAHDELHDRIKDGTFVQDGNEAYYLYEQTFRGRTQTGIVCCASIDDYVNGVIKKHENTRPEKENDRIRHIDACDAHTGPIFLCHRRDETLAGIVKRAKEAEPFIAFTSDDGVKNRVWVIDEPDTVKAIRDAFAAIPAVYIADGHHRCASAAKVGLKRREEGRATDASDHFLAVLFPDDELEILDYNRVVKDLNGFGKGALLNRIAEDFAVEELPDGQQAKPKEKGTFGMYLDGNWYMLTAKDRIKSDDPVEGLDASVLQNALLHPILGIGDPRTDKRIDFVGGIRGMDELERRCKEDCAVAFSLYPTSIAELFGVADAGLLMPPKSTWFEPKLLSGLFIHMM